MKKILIVAVIFLHFVSLHAKGSNVYLGPEVFYFNLNSSFKGLNIQGSKCFCGIKIGYEYLRPALIYIGIDFLASAADGVYHESLKGESIPKCSGRSAFVDYELRLGYSIFRPNCLTTLFLCQGAYVFGTGSELHHYNALNSYLGGGIRYRYSCSPIFNPGVNIKIFGSIAREEKWKFFEAQRTTHHGAWGGEIAVPLIWYVGGNKLATLLWNPIFSKST